MVTESRSQEESEVNEGGLAGKVSRGGVKDLRQTEKLLRANRGIFTCTARIDVINRPHSFRITMRIQSAEYIHRVEISIHQIRSIEEGLMALGLYGGEGTLCMLT